MAAVFRDGHDPFTGESLGRSFQSESAVVGFDLTFTAVKSVSVLWGLADDTTRATVYAAHRAALDQSLAFVERTVIRTRVGEGGCRQVRTRGMIAAAFDHWDTRAGDPNLHTHVVLANKVQGPDGCWRSLDGKSIYATVVTVSVLYDTLLADELARRLPVTGPGRHNQRHPRRCSRRQKTSISPRRPTRRPHQTFICKKPLTSDHAKSLRPGDRCVVRLSLPDRLRSRQ